MELQLIAKRIFEMNIDKIDDIYIIDLEYNYPINNVSQLAHLLVEIENKDSEADFGDISTPHDVIVNYKRYDSVFKTNGFDLICAIKKVKNEKI